MLYLTLYRPTWVAPSLTCFHKGPRFQTLAFSVKGSQVDGDMKNNLKSWTAASSQNVQALRTWIKDKSAPNALQTSLWQQISAGSVRSSWSLFFVHSNMVAYGMVCVNVQVWGVRWQRRSKCSWMFRLCRDFLEGAEFPGKVELFHSPTLV